MTNMHDPNNPPSNDPNWKFRSLGKNDGSAWTYVDPEWSKIIRNGVLIVASMPFVAVGFWAVGSVFKPIGPALSAGAGYAMWYGAIGAGALAVNRFGVRKVEKIHKRIGARFPNTSIGKSAEKIDLSRSVSRNPGYGKKAFGVFVSSVALMWGALYGIEKKPG
jgi:hypothetical protein